MGKKLEVMVVVGGLLSLLLAKVQNNQTTISKSFIFLTLISQTLILHTLNLKPSISQTSIL